MEDGAARRPGILARLRAATADGPPHAIRPG
jgi:hypothetical protein